MFSRKDPCPRCNSMLKRSFDFCPYCGCDVRNPERDLQEYGMLGKNELSANPPASMGLGVTDKLLNSLFTGLMKTLESQMRGMAAPEVQNSPNGITIRVSPPSKSRSAKRSVSQEQIKRMNGLPRVEAKSDVRRLSDKVVYELKTPDVSSVEDVFVSKVESGYEVKAIGKNKVYVNTFSLDLPLKGFALDERGLTVEFSLA